MGYSRLLTSFDSGSLSISSAVRCFSPPQWALRGTDAGILGHDSCVYEPAKCIRAAAAEGQRRAMDQCMYE